MDLGLLKWGLDNRKNKKKWVIALGILGMSYGVYRVYQSPSVANKRKKWSQMLGAIVSVAELMSDSAEAIGLVSKDLKEFLKSDSDEIPNSFKQISKITSSDEFSESLTEITRALTLGILMGYRQDTVKKSDFSEVLLDKLFSKAGTGFASVVVGSFARNLVMAYYSNLDTKPSSTGSDTEVNSVPVWVNLISSDEKCREVMGDLVQVFVSTAVTVYLDKTTHIDSYTELLSGMTNPKHETRVRELLSALCNGAVETLVRTFLQAQKNNNMYSDGNHGKMLVQRHLISRNNLESGWMRKMTYTLAVPSNRKLVLDVTGRVTFETVKCFLEYLLERISDCLKRSVDVIQEEVIDKRIVVVKQQVSRRSSAVLTVCLSLCFHVLNSPWIFAPNY